MIIQKICNAKRGQKCQSLRFMQLRHTYRTRYLCIKLTMCVCYFLFQEPTGIKYLEDEEYNINLDELFDSAQRLIEW